MSVFIPQSSYEKLQVVVKGMPVINNAKIYCFAFRTGQNKKQTEMVDVRKLTTSTLNALLSFDSTSGP